MNDIQTEMVWHKDGHVIYLQLNKSEVAISMVHCPGNEERECNVGKFNCIVKYFVEMYGLDCNVGSCECAPEIEVAWCAVGDFDDPEQSQVWIIPIEDEAFSAWLVTQPE